MFIAFIFNIEKEEYSFTIMTVIQATILNYALIKSKSCPRLGISPYANSCKEMLVLLASKQKCVLSEGA